MRPLLAIKTPCYKVTENTYYIFIYIYLYTVTQKQPKKKKKRHHKLNAVFDTALVKTKTPFSSLTAHCC